MNNRISKFDEAMQRLEEAWKEDEDFASRYFCLSGETYVRLYFRLSHEPGRIGSWEEIDVLEHAEDVLQAKGIKYKYPQVGKDLPEKPDFVQYMKEGNLEDAIFLLKHYGFEIEESSEIIGV